MPMIRYCFKLRMLAFLTWAKPPGGKAWELMEANDPLGPERAVQGRDRPGRLLVVRSGVAEHGGQGIRQVTSWPTIIFERSTRRSNPCTGANTNSRNRTPPVALWSSSSPNIAGISGF